ncbi:MAG: acylphosphatase [Deltaproteobacteria bacterium]|nr:acylphosphatase [Deltaproteobacteria bacterium]
MTKSMQFIVSGKVQGVGFRAWVREQAEALGLTGWVRNLRDSEVEILAQGPEEKMNELRTRLVQGSTFSHVKDVKGQWIEYDKGYEHFSVR